MCLRDKAECEYADASGGMSDAEARVLRSAYAEELVQINEPVAQEATPMLLDGGDSPVLAVIRAEMLVGNTRAQIVEALNERGVTPPPNKRKWTIATVSKIIKDHGVERGTKPSKVRDRVVEAVDKVGGAWSGYWPTSHPLRHVHVLDAPSLDTEQPSAHVTCNASSLLTALVGYAVTPASALANRPKREDNEQ